MSYQDRRQEHAVDRQRKYSRLFQKLTSLLLGNGFIVAVIIAISSNGATPYAYANHPDNDGCPDVEIVGETEMDGFVLNVATHERVKAP